MSGVEPNRGVPRKTDSQFLTLVCGAQRVETSQELTGKPKNRSSRHRTHALIAVMDEDGSADHVMPQEQARRCADG